MGKDPKGTKNPSQTYFEMSIRSPPFLVGKAEDGAESRNYLPWFALFRNERAVLIIGLYKRGGAIMKKAITALVLSLVILVALGTEAKAQIPKESTISETSYYSGTFKALPMGQERVQMNYESMGLVIGETPEDLFHNASFRCLGALHAVKGEYNNSGSCVCTRPDGDQVFVTYKSVGKLGGNAKGTLTYVGGTGKLTGIQGNSEYMEFFMRPAAEGTFQAYQRIKGQYKSP